MPLPLLAVPLLTPQAVAISAVGATLAYKGGQYVYRFVDGILTAKKDAAQYEVLKTKVYAKIEGSRTQGHRIVLNWFSFSASMSEAEFRSCSLLETCNKMIVKLAHEATSRGERGPNADEVMKAIIEANRQIIILS